MRAPLAAACLLACTSVLADEPAVVLESTPARVSLIELFTSEGCSSCPPAERWMNSLENDPRLWRDFVPVAFHVDYWNYLGWPDRFASPAHSERQRDYARSGHVSSVYTPGLVLAGDEWRGWFRRPVLDLADRPEAGPLAVTVRDGRVEAVYRAPDPAGPVELHVARLGFDMSTPVRAGENAGKRLDHAFVVLGWTRAAMVNDNAGWRGSAPLPEASVPAPRTGLAAWVSRPGDPRPLQAVGGWLPR